MVSFNSLIKRIKSNIRRRRKTQKRKKPRLESWEQFDEAAMDELIEDIERHAQEDIEELGEDLHNPN